MARSNMFMSKEFSRGSSSGGRNWPRRRIESLIVKVLVRSGVRCRSFGRRNRDFSKEAE